MRSGTSMMMQALEAGGMAVVKSPERQRVNERVSDAQYRANPIDLYEPAVAETRRPGFPRWHDGKTIKLVLPWLAMMSVHAYRVVFMRRDPEEIRQSYEAAFGERVTSALISQRVEEALHTLRNRRDVETLTEAWYPCVVREPRAFFESLDWPVAVADAARVIRADARRFQREQLVIGI